MQHCVLLISNRLYFNKVSLANCLPFSLESNDDFTRVNRVIHSGDLKHPLESSWTSTRVGGKKHSSVPISREIRRTHFTLNTRSCFSTTSAEYFIWDNLHWWQFLLYTLYIYYITLDISVIASITWQSQHFARISMWWVNPNSKKSNMYKSPAIGWRFIFFKCIVNGCYCHYISFTKFIIWC